MGLGRAQGQHRDLVGWARLDMAVVDVCESPGLHGVDLFRHPGDLVKDRKRGACRARGRVDGPADERASPRASVAGGSISRGGRGGRQGHCEGVGGPLGSGQGFANPVPVSLRSVILGSTSRCKPSRPRTSISTRPPSCLDLSENIRTLLVTPDREVRVEVVIELDSGQDRQLHRLSGPARQRAGPVQGGLALSSPGRPGRGPLAGQPDDLEDGAGRPPLRRRQGGDQLRSHQALAGRAGAADPQVHREDPRHDRARQGHPRPRHGDRCSGHGLDHERIWQVRGLPPGVRDRQAGRVPRLGGPRGGHGLRRGDRHPRDPGAARDGRSPARPSPSRVTATSAATPRGSSGAAGGQDRRRLRRLRRGHQPGGLDIAELDRHVGRGPQGRRLQGGRAGDERTTPDDAGRRPDPRGPGGRLRPRDGPGRRRPR